MSEGRQKRKEQEEIETEDRDEERWRAGGEEGSWSVDHGQRSMI